MLLFIGLILSSCQEEFIPDFADEEPTIVVEGYIQAGVQAAPVLVTIGKTFPLIQTSDQIKGPEIFLGGAKVQVESNGETIELTEVCTDSLDPSIKEILLSTLGFDESFFDLEICFYTDLLGEIDAIEGATYNLLVEFEGAELTASTTIPTYVPIDSFNIFNPTGDPSKRQLNGYLTDPLLPNFYRLKLSANNGPLGNTFSVVDDVLFDGQSFEFPINNQPDQDDEDFDPTTAGLFSVGDSILIQWQSIDAEHYEFWNTLEFARNNQGPFASYTRAASNINGGIGIWGGSSIGYYNVVIE